MNDNTNDNNNDNFTNEDRKQEPELESVDNKVVNNESIEPKTEPESNVSTDKELVEQTSNDIETEDDGNLINEANTEILQADQSLTLSKNTDPKAFTLSIEKAKKPLNKKLIIAIIIVIALVIGGAAVFLILFNKPDAKKADTMSAVKLIGAELSVVDGTVNVSKDNTVWADAKVGDQIAQGTYIRTQDGARAVVALDDGSAIRLNSGSVVKIDDLTASNIVLSNVSGTVYTRVVKSDRSFSVKVANESYSAMGTAYITQNTASTKGVEVYESNVKIKSTNLQVPEGKFYYTESTSVDLSKKLSDIPIDKLKQDTFLAWNYQQDKANAEFKDKLGYLAKMDNQPTPNATPSVQPATATTGITLSGTKYDTGVKLVWDVNSVAVTKGFKVVKGLSANPTYGKDEAVYVSDSSTRSYAWTLKDGKTYNFRICTYTGDSCTNYSNNITITAPKVEDSSSSGQLPAGSLNLVRKGGNNVGWTLTGSAPYGYKLVWSKTTNPIYPGSDYQYYSSESTRTGAITPSEPGTYYVRVCMYNTTGNGDKCLNYSNQITIP